MRNERQSFILLRSRSLRGSPGNLKIMPLRARSGSGSALTRARERVNEKREDETHRPAWNLPPSVPHSVVHGSCAVSTSLPLPLLSLAAPSSNEMSSPTGATLGVVAGVAPSPSRSRPRSSARSGERNHSEKKVCANGLSAFMSGRDALRRTRSWAQNWSLVGRSELSWRICVLEPFRAVSDRRARRERAREGERERTMRRPWKSVKPSANAPGAVPSWPGASFSTRRMVASGSVRRHDRRSSDVKVRKVVERYSLPVCVEGKHRSAEVSGGRGRRGGGEEGEEERT